MMIDPVKELTYLVAGLVIVLAIIALIGAIFWMILHAPAVLAIILLALMSYVIGRVLFITRRCL